ncbi:DUF5005 domain-containing protein [Actinomadura madurae]|uniref:DUF4185 domain-containing protein n=1 Tax=Actinomadura madurae TaxID=1993 RepID=A0A1I5IXX7_9ACTN|nr:DUF5005 domain-containing protein [Actinomadura madurae]SFO65415.1 protein of unknown function [Actinomadura madurae]SPT58506.1 Uncharacterised protein [Actinomadura madurae]
MQESRPSSTERPSRLHARRWSRAAALASALLLAAPAVPAAADTHGHGPSYGAGHDKARGKGHAAEADAPTCSGHAPPTFGTATQNAALNGKFTSYGNSNALLDDWTGADTTYSLKLSDGRIVYAYSDTFLGRVNADGSRPVVIEEGGTTPFLNNSFVVQGTGGALTTVHGGTAAAPKAVMPPAQAAHWYWAGDLTQSGSEVQQLYREYYDPDPNNGTGWDMKFKDNVLARFSAGNLSAPTQVKAMPSASGVQWGSALLRDGGHTYIYGTEDYTDPDTQVNTKYLHIARVDGTDLRGAWEYRTAGGWSTSETASARLMSGVSNEFSVARRGSHYVMVNQDASIAFGAEIDVLLSCSADGPFTGEQTVYRTPETGPFGSYGDPDVFTYNAHQHASLSSGGNLVISYNVNSLDATKGPANDNYRDVTIYRARYINLPVSG